MVFFIVIEFILNGKKYILLFLFEFLFIEYLFDKKRLEYYMINVIIYESVVFLLNLKEKRKNW